MNKKSLIAGTLTLLFAATACGSSTYEATPVPTKPAPAKPTPAQVKPQPDCGNPLASYAPEPGLLASAQFPADSYITTIKKRGRLIAGVSADSLHLGARNPITGVIEGFDIAMVTEVAKALGVSLELRVISSPQRIPVIVDGSVDIVARNMTINCERWGQIAFSAEYYRSGQKVLVPLDSKAKSLRDLPGKTICAPAASTSLDNMVRLFPMVKPITADSDGGCLVLFQQGKAYGITGDDTVLAGEAAQDPYAKVIKDERFSEEPYGLGMSLEHPEFVRFVNAVLADMKASGRWKIHYDDWLAEDLGTAPTPPAAVYGRS
ncbi:polar amino acid transport system substrate-binding protein [Kribbella orskensis]|uniref:Polar amino acid transport system substrate-binding protein n=1 Tax=Kribbella orskensis TaxID=2512216 RepID=A0ABY2BI16_9ACTN|nr:MULTISPECIES: glutamate ABC transporter substrate-binding protein [Kribbella]TCN38823.1 polar amino acid transport system substrate-binding protein [Kribbella sp. VKM Ac-2500]TCO21004.1 polar amino acid transport system substrate-binding protein [Kribbella orskensis]